jgi:hypothetical protein
MLAEKISQAFKEVTDDIEPHVPEPHEKLESLPDTYVISEWDTYKQLDSINVKNWLALTGSQIGY